MWISILIAASRANRWQESSGDIEDENEDDIYIYKVNVNYDRELAEKYKVMSVPTVICFVNGEAKGKTVGLKEQEEIEELFEKYI